ncbi:REP-associated tyrosine transposase [Pseudomonas helleri]|uniref:REP-associated tyrosine transposase n=1 Tax=Pseudomonas helleri TaxID=1608996 RepID=UPI00242CDC4B|nr:transposase [Pseudomonas helleri]
MPSFPASHRLRHGRFSEPNRIYLLTANTLNREPVFHDWRVGRLVVEQLRSAQEQGFVDSLAWVVMPDHFHWLVVLQRSSLDQLMCRTKSLSTRAINQATGRTGSRWQQGYHDHALRNEEDLKRMARYVIANPLRAGLVKRVGDYPLWDAIWL